MWEGISLKDFQRNIYKNFYSDSDVELIIGAENADLQNVKQSFRHFLVVGPKICEQPIGICQHLFSRNGLLLNFYRKRKPLFHYKGIGKNGKGRCE